ncbi:izumo sperm-egg fusion protein 4 isoform X4 [Fukomys damarensis]|uniref:izumo sperm-egg fusion protein 4 isoform X4 n=1 Tax=Fukomys damarensis TaxID=885580 RepID=UPI0008FF119D|nr:izumo sperm-egg fusion protein 4 isoform X4 [Fukomys damarensis]XP_019064689.1 izumo sperm-egg fusion protein 4 isoform X4 [Fukomys damarensis]
MRIWTRWPELCTGRWIGCTRGRCTSRDISPVSFESYSASRCISSRMPSSKAKSTVSVTVASFSTRPSPAITALTRMSSALATTASPPQSGRVLCRAFSFTYLIGTDLIGGQDTSMRVGTAARALCVPGTTGHLFHHLTHVTPLGHLMNELPSSSCIFLPGTRRATPAFLSPSILCLEPQHLVNLTLENTSECLTQH